MLAVISKLLKSNVTGLIGLPSRSRGSNLSEVSAGSTVIHQYMIALNGKGTAKVADVARKMIPIGSGNYTIEEMWFIIDRNVSHEFIPEGEDMAVISFHTCESSELEEVSCETGESRRYH